MGIFSLPYFMKIVRFDAENDSFYKTLGTI